MKVLNSDIIGINFTCNIFFIIVNNYYRNYKKSIVKKFDIY